MTMNPQLQILSLELGGVIILFAVAFGTLAWLFLRKLRHDKQAALAVGQSREQRLNHLLSRTTAAIFTANAQGDFEFTFVSDGVQALMGCTPAEFLNTPGYWLDHMHPQDVPRFRAQKSVLMAQGNLVFEYRFLHKDGRYRWLRDDIRLFRDAQGEPFEIVGYLIDVTHDHEAQAQLRASEERFRMLTHLSSDWFWEQDKDFRFVHMVGDVVTVAGVEILDHIGKTRWELPVLNLSEDDWTRHKAVLMAHQEFRDLELRRPDVNGRAHWFAVSGSPLFDENGEFTGYRGIGRDITAQKLAQAQIHSLAFFDALTQLPNRRLLSEQLQTAMLTHVRNRSHAALLFIDLDNFKTLNDTLGHDQGDRFLQQVAQRLKASVREDDVVARLGGDEFVVMLEGLGSDSFDAAAQAESVAIKVLAALNRSYPDAPFAHHCSASMGVTLFGQLREAIEEPLKRGDLAMYQAKAAGRGTIRFFEPPMQAAVSRRASMEVGLREALAKQQLLIHYQPQVRLPGHVVGVEALVRWRHPQMGLISPAEFIPLAEETGLILPLGQWVLESACQQLQAWSLQAGREHLSMAVNVSPRQFQHPDFVQQVITTLDNTGAQAHRLTLELTEGMLVSNVDEVVHKMTALQRAGVSFSLDDFGTGYSSLSHLKRMPLQQLKIDKSFVRDILEEPNDAAIAKLVVDLAASLGIGVIAEGVETQAQCDFLAGLGCHAAQGYLFGRPQPLADLEQSLALCG